MTRLFNVTPKMRTLTVGKSSILTVIDLGTTKTTCIIARLEPTEAAEAARGASHRCRVLGIGHQRTRGLKGGLITDMSEAERAVRTAIDAAERMAGTTVEKAVVAITGGRIGSQHFMAEVGIGGRIVQDRDVSRAMSAAIAQAQLNGRAVLHALPTAHRIDGGAPVREPRGMAADRVTVDMHVASTDTGAARNLMLAVERCHMEVEAVIATPYASGLAVLEQDDAELGTVVIDCGGGTTSAAVFAGGALQHIDAIAVGGNHVTMDLARGLSMRLEDAERLKCLAASCDDSDAAQREMITVPCIGDDDQSVPVYMPRADVTRIVKPRVEETLEVMRDRLRSAGFGNILSRGLVLTGGASQLSGMTSLAQGILSRNARLGRPIALKGMPESAKNPAFATTVGLLIYPQVAGQEYLGSTRGTHAATGTDGYFTRMGRWLRDSF
jgi:cell division protein FtsA